VARKPTVRELRERAGLQIRELSLASDVSEASINRMERKQAVGVVLVNKILRVINERLGADYEAHDVDVPLL
jgi:transcriptional regulator with XRE-family HTH domain